MPKPGNHLFYVRYSGYTNTARSLDSKLKVTCTQSEEGAAKAYVRKFYGDHYEAVRTGGYLNTGAALWHEWEARKKAVAS